MRGQEKIARCRAGCRSAAAAGTGAAPPPPGGRTACAASASRSSGAAAAGRRRPSRRAPPPPGPPTCAAAGARGRRRRRGSRGTKRCGAEGRRKRGGLTGSALLACWRLRRLPFLGSRNSSVSLQREKGSAPAGRLGHVGRRAVRDEVADVLRTRGGQGLKTVRPPSRLLPQTM